MRGSIMAGSALGVDKFFIIGTTATGAFLSGRDPDWIMWIAAGTVSLVPDRVLDNAGTHPSGIKTAATRYPCSHDQTSCCSSPQPACCRSATRSITLSAQSPGETLG